MHILSIFMHVNISMVLLGNLSVVAVVVLPV